MQINPKLIKNQFEKNMDKYDKNAIVQQLMAEKLIEELMKIQSGFNNVFELGAGTGLLTKELIKKVKYKKFYANDLSEKSKYYLDKILSDYVFTAGNAQKIKPTRKMDLIISNAMFQWFKDIEKVVAHYNNILEKNGILAFTSFSPDNFCEIKDLTGLSLEYSELEDITKILEKSFTVLYTRKFDHKLTFNSPLELLAHMKNTGVNSLTTKHWTFKDVKEFCNKYSEKYPEITLTYSPIIIIARKN